MFIILIALQPFEHVRYMYVLYGSLLRTIKYGEIPEIVNAVTGWETTLWELMKAGERRLNMMRVFNIRSGIGAEEDKIPEKVV